MNSEKRQRLVGTIKTALLALIITIFLVVMVAGKRQNAAKRNSAKTHNLEQKVSKLETALRDNQEMLRETKEANRNLRDMLSELRGIHNDCQRNATENFLHPPQRR